MKHILDNPAWNALISGNESLSNGNSTAKYFSPEVAFFAGIPAMTREHFEMLYETVPFDIPVAIVTNDKTIDPRPWNIIHRIDGFQMMYKGTVGPKKDNIRLEPLSDIHVPEMLALTKLTNPGPFCASTILLGHYEGVFRDNKLVAMAGQRLHSFEYAEISAVCTHPDYLGNGYARELLLSQVRRIQDQSELPYLHVRDDNARAIKVYESLGFETREEMQFFILKK